MLRHLGYVATALSVNAGVVRTCRLRNATPERLRELIDANLAELERAIRHNIERGIFLYRISSDLIPFASHPANTVPWWDEQADRLERLGAQIRQHGIRVTMHPGQFTVLNSERAEVVASSVLELAWHARFLDLLGTGPPSKIILHVGGTGGGKPAAMDRFARAVDGLDDAIRRRLVIENDEHNYAIEDVLELSARTGLPVIFDNLHDLIYHNRHDGPARVLPDVFATWPSADGPPKVHFSTQAPGGRPGLHADFLDPDDVVRFLEMAPADIAYDGMIEAKQKDIALFRLREELRQRGWAEAGPSESGQVRKRRKTG